MVGWMLGMALAAAPSVDAPPVGSANATDAAVVISNELYTGFNRVSYATRDGDAFEQWLKRTRGVPKVNVMRVKDATKRGMLTAISRAATQAGSGGTLWVYYAGHGLGMRPPGKADAERVLLGINAVAKPEELVDYVVPISEIEAAVAGSPAASVVLVMDACFNNAGRDGGALVDGRFAVPAGRLGARGKLTVWSATDADQTAVPYVPAEHGAFTYFAIGALSGWADGVEGARDGRVTLDEAQSYVSRALSSVGILGQTPQISTGSSLGASLVAAAGSLQAEPSADFPSADGRVSAVAPVKPAAPVPAPAPAVVAAPAPTAAPAAAPKFEVDPELVAWVADMVPSESAPARRAAPTSGAATPSSSQRLTQFFTPLTTLPPRFSSNGTTVDWSAGSVATLRGGFETGRRTLTADGRAAALAIAGAMIERGMTRLRIEVHTDSMGNDAENLSLSQQRATTFGATLGEAGWLGTLETNGFGETRPLADNATAVGRAANRRLVVTPAK